MRFPSAPMRGVSSISRMPAADSVSSVAVEVVHGEADMMNAGPAPGDEPGDRRVVLAGFEQFHQRIAGGEPGDGGAVGVVERHLGHAEHVAVEGQQRRRAHCTAIPMWAMRVPRRGDSVMASMS